MVTWRERLIGYVGDPTAPTPQLNQLHEGCIRPMPRFPINRERLRAWTIRETPLSVMHYIQPVVRSTSRAPITLTRVKSATP